MMRRMLVAAGAFALLSSVPAAQAEAPKCNNFLVCLFGQSRHHHADLGQATGIQSGVRDQYGHSINLTGASRRETVRWHDSKYAVGTIIIKTPERALYYISGDGEAIKYAIGVGREGFQWSGASRIAAKAEWPDWTPPKEMVAREALKGHHLPDHMDGGPGNPLGARAMYLGGRMYRIHGTNNEASIGGAVSSGCIRMMNADVIDLYDRVRIGAKVIVYQ